MKLYSGSEGNIFYDDEWLPVAEIVNDNTLLLDGEYTLTELKDMIRLMERRDGYPLPPYAYN